MERNACRGKDGKDMPKKKITKKKPFIGNASLVFD